jgi:hypothetical protein
MDLNNLNGLKDKLSGDNLKDFSGGKGIKKTILGVVIVILLGALGMETTNTDYDLGKLLGGSSVKEAKVLRDKSGNVVTDSSLGKATDEYNCSDFSTQDEAQNFFEKAGGVSKDTNRLDGNKDGVACQDLPKK